jgi:hypothetical protein
VKLEQRIDESPIARVRVESKHPALAVRRAQIAQTQPRAERARESGQRIGVPSVINATKRPDFSS